MRIHSSCDMHVSVCECIDQETGYEFMTESGMYIQIMLGV